jgi:hypothetical protein
MKNYYYSSEEFGSNGSVTVTKHRQFVKDAISSRVREKAVEQLLKSNQQKRQSFMKKFRNDPDNRRSLIKELVHEILPEDEMEDSEKNDFIEFLNSLGQEFESSPSYDFYLRLEDDIHKEVSEMEGTLEEEYDVNYDFREENEEDQIICPFCW